jgi:hypothetical protein
VSFLFALRWVFLLMLAGAAGWLAWLAFHRESR